MRALLRRHRNLWCDLAFRSEQGAGGKVPAEWRALFTEFPDRFMVGTDTFTPERWHYIVEHANWSRAWLADLPPPLAERIAWRNGEALFGHWIGTAQRSERRTPRCGLRLRRCALAVAADAVGCGETLRPVDAHALRTRATTIAFATVPAPIVTGGTFALDFAVCPRAGVAPPTGLCASTRRCRSTGTA